MPGLHQGTIDLECPSCSVRGTAQLVTASDAFPESWSVSPGFIIKLPAENKFAIECANCGAKVYPGTSGEVLDQTRPSHARARLTEQVAATLAVLRRSRQST